jgi:hypothetical protein
MRYAIANKLNNQAIYGNNVTVVNNVAVSNVNVVVVPKAWRVPGSKAV